VRRAGEGVVVEVRQPTVAPRRLDPVERGEVGSPSACAPRCRAGRRRRDGRRRVAREPVEVGARPDFDEAAVRPRARRSSAAAWCRTRARGWSRVRGAEAGDCQQRDRVRPVGIGRIDAARRSESAWWWKTRASRRPADAAGRRPRRLRCARFRPQERVRGRSTTVLASRRAAALRDGSRRRRMDAVQQAADGRAAR
jgi:hypothetical protein